MGGRVEGGEAVCAWPTDMVPSRWHLWGGVAFAVFAFGVLLLCFLGGCSDAFLSLLIVSLVLERGALSASGGV